MSLITFEPILLTLINGAGLFLIIIVLANSFKERLYRWFVVLTIFLLGWVDFAYLGYIESSPGSALIAYRLNLAFVSAFFFAAYVFYIDCFLRIRRPIFKGILFLISSVFVVLSLFTSTIIDAVFVRDWGNEIHFGSVYPAFSVFAVIISIIFLYYFVTRYSTLPALEKKKIIFFLIGTFFFIALNVIFNIITTTLLNTSKYQHYGDYSAIIFLTFTVFAVVGRKFLNVRVALAAFVVSAMSLLLIFDIITIVSQGLKITMFVIFIGLSTILMRSITNEIRQKEQLAKINKALDESRQKYIDLASEQKDIIDVMGHEIRTPLTAIVQEIKIHKKYTLPVEKELLEEAKGLPQLSKVVPYLIETVKTVDRASTHAVALVSDMLETARLDKNRFELNYEVFDLVGVVRSNVELMQKSVDTENTSVKYDLKFVEPEFQEFSVEADKTRIGQAVYAVVNNALKYRDPEKPDISVKVSLEKTSTDAIITVEDNGIGIDKEDISKLGKKFMRLNPKTKGNLKRPGGTGLGLFVVKGIMEHHHGDMLVESAGIGHGSTFTLRFPVKAVINT